jgi:hypothetical protein
MAAPVVVTELKGAGLDQAVRITIEVMGPVDDESETGRQTRAQIVAGLVSELGKSAAALGVALSEVEPAPPQ